MVIYMILRCSFHASRVGVGGCVGSSGGPIGDFVLARGGHSDEKILKFGCLIFCINFINLMG